jgi:hypothetical protein
VYVKWLTEVTSTGADDNQLLPLWYAGTIISLLPTNETCHSGTSNVNVRIQQDKGSVRVAFEDSVTAQRQEVVVSCLELLSADKIGEYSDDSSSSTSSSTGSVTDNFFQARLHYAKECKYISYSIPAGTHITAMYWEDDQSDYVEYKAQVLHWQEVNWHKVSEKSCRREYMGEVGPFIPVEWEVDDSWTIIPLHHVVSPVRLDPLSY